MVRAELQCDTAVVMLLDGAHQALTLAAAAGMPGDEHQGARVLLGSGFNGRVAEENKPLILDEIAESPAHGSVARRIGLVSLLGVPLHIGGEVIGTLTVGSRSRRFFTSGDVESVARHAEAVVTALERRGVVGAQLAAEALQASLSPRLPSIAGFDIAARYVPSSDHGVGGDWYDIFELDEHHIAITLGDVMGHGLHSATVMGRVRSALRAYALIDHDPASVLTLLDRKVTRFDVGELTTMLYAVLDVRTGQLTMSRAGHPPALLLRRGGRVQRLQTPVDLPLGVDHTQPRHSEVYRLGSEYLLCFYSDGLTDARHHDFDSAIRRVSDTLRHHAEANAERICTELMSRMTGSRSASDDVSLLLVKHTGAPAH